MEISSLVEYFDKASQNHTFLGEKFKSIAYSKATDLARSIESFSELKELLANQPEGTDLAKVIKEQYGFGDTTAAKTLEWFNTGKIETLDRVNQEVIDNKIASGIDYDNLLKIEGMGLTRIRKLNDILGVKTLNDFKQACEDHRVSTVPGFGPKIEVMILEGISNIDFYKKRYPRKEIEEKIWNKLRAFFTELGFTYLEEDKINTTKGDSLLRMLPVGSFRRKAESSKDFDILIESNGEPGMAEFISKKLQEQDFFEKFTANGSTKISFVVKDPINFHIDVRIVNKDEFGAAMQYFTGSREHNIELRKIAIAKSMKLNEYGLFKISGDKEEKIAGENEEDIYSLLGVSYKNPKDRTEKIIELV